MVRELALRFFLVLVALAALGAYELELALETEPVLLAVSSFVLRREMRIRAVVTALPSCPSCLSLSVVVYLWDDSVTSKLTVVMLS